MFLLRSNRNSRGPGSVLQVPEDKVRVVWPERYREVYRRHVDGLGSISQLEGTGKIRKDELELRVGYHEPSAEGRAPRFAAIGGDGRGAYDSWERQHRIEKSAKAVKAKVRRLRIADAVKIEEIDAEIQRLREAEALARAQRDQIVREAWGKAHVVLLSKLTSMADEELEPINMDEIDVLPGGE